MNTLTTIVAVIFSTFAADSNESQMPQVQPEAPAAQALQIPAPDIALMHGYERFLENRLEFSPTRNA